MTYMQLDLSGLGDLTPDEKLMMRLGIAIGALANECGESHLADEIASAIVEWAREKGLNKPC